MVNVFNKFLKMVVANATLALVQLISVLINREAMV